MRREGPWNGAGFTEGAGPVCCLPRVCPESLLRCLLGHNLDWSCSGSASLSCPVQRGHTAARLGEGDSKGRGGSLVTGWFLGQL